MWREREKEKERERERIQERERERERENERERERAKTIETWGAAPTHHRAYSREHRGFSNTRTSGVFNSIRPSTSNH